MKIAIVHDDFVQWGGAERLVAAMAEIYPEALVFTSMVRPEVVKKSGINPNRFRVSGLNRVPAKKLLNKIIFPFYPLAFESFDFSEYDVVLSSSTRFAHGIVTKPSTYHVNYINSPFRGFWEPSLYFGRSLRGRALKWFLQPVLSRLRIWDYCAGQRPDCILANSCTTRDRVNKYYRRWAEVVYPFVDLQRFESESDPGFAPPSEYFLMISRLVEWKKFDVVVEAFNQMHKHLIIVGDGPFKSTLKKIAGPTVKVVDEYLKDPQVTYLMRRCRALIHPQKEDFGMTVVEANACGRPVIAFNQGGATETVIDGKTGTFFDEQSVESIIQAVSRFSELEFAERELIEYAQKFSRQRFVEEIKRYVERYVQTS